MSEIVDGPCIFKTDEMQGRSKQGCFCYSYPSICSCMKWQVNDIRFPLLAILWVWKKKFENPAVCGLSLDSISLRHLWGFG